MNDILNNFSEIAIESPVDNIIRQIKKLISSGEIQPGTKFPPERKLAEKFGVGRSYVREAIKKLEFYGIVKTLPQSGTLVSGMGIAAIEGLISDVLKLNEDDFSSLIETRYILEVQSARLAAKRRLPEDIVMLNQALADYETEVLQGNVGMEQDLMLHIKIAETSKNDVLKSLMMIITPDILRNYSNKELCMSGQTKKALNEHRAILSAIENGNEDEAAEMMHLHLQDILNSVKP